MNEHWHHVLFPSFDPVYPRMEAAMEVLKKFIAIHFLCVSLCLLKLNRFPKRKKKKKKKAPLSHQQRALRGLEDGRYLVFWRGSSFHLFLYGRHFETPLIQSHIGAQEMWPQHKHCAGFPMLECSWQLWGSIPAQSNHILGGKFHKNNSSLLESGCGKQSSIFIANPEGYNWKMGQSIITKHR